MASVLDFGFIADDRVRADREAADAADSWARVPEMFRAQKPLPAPWEERFGPLKSGAVDELVVLGQFGQSLDGRVATESGNSHYINGPAGLAHLHRLRALVDIVIVGIGTALADDPQLTVRHVPGPCPARAVIDPRGRISAGARMWTADGARRLILTAEGARPDVPPGIERIALPAAGGVIEPAAILVALAERGFRRIMIEGGAETVSRFLAAGCLDRLHVTVAPTIIGSGRPGFVLPPVERADQAMRLPMRVYQLDDEVLFDCDLSAQRVPVGQARKST